MQLEARRMRLQLQWAPRDVNQEADDLTNGRTAAFSASLRLQCDPTTWPWMGLDQLLQQGRLFHSARLKNTAHQVVGHPPTGAPKRRKLSERQPW